MMNGKLLKAVAIVGMLMMMAIGNSVLAVSPAEMETTYSAEEDGVQYTVTEAITNEGYKISCAVRD